MDMVEHAALSPLAAEVQAMLHGLRLAQRMQIKVCQVCSDSLTAIRMINSEIDMLLEVEHWVLTIQNMCQEFLSISFTHISRNSNLRADALAKDTLHHTRSMLWMSDYPSWLLVLDNDAQNNCNVICPS